MILIENVDVYAPESLGKKSVLIGGGKLLGVVPPESMRIEGLPVTRIHAEGKLLIPGLVDPLVHFTGGGGEGGYTSRTPEMMLSEAIEGGTTTLVGALGTDAITRSLENLLAKARALEEEGVSTYCYTGSYQVPPKTLFSGIQEDLMLIDKFIGVGEVAISDHRSSQPTIQELARLASQCRVGGMLSGKVGIVFVHVGDGPAMLGPLYEVANQTDLPLSQFYPTHINRHQALLKAGVAFVEAGGYIDLTTSTTPQLLEMGEVEAPCALRWLLDQGVRPDRITLSSDGNASLPCFNGQGEMIGLTVGKPKSLFEALKSAVLQHGVDIATALATATLNPATALKLPGKGQIKVGADADVLLIDRASWTLDTVIARGQIMMYEGRILKRGRFE